MVKKRPGWLRQTQHLSRQQLENDVALRKPAELSLEDENLSGLCLPNGDLRGANLRRTRLDHAELSCAVLCGANLRESNLRGATLDGADLRTSVLYKANLSKARLCGAVLCGANLGEALLVDGHLQGADLRGAYLWKTNLLSATLQGADLRGANLRGALLQRADLRGADLRGAAYDAHTHWPENFLPAEHGAIECQHAPRW